jgi:uncharacterized protein YndB with AHSA1/START domain
MSDTLQIQIALQAPPDAMMRAWTDHLSAWFAEYADVSILEKRFDFWGRYTPGVPDREAGHHPLLAYEDGKRLTFGWTLGGEETTVDIEIQPRDGHQLLTLRHSGSAPEDFWFLSLENLRRHLDNKPPVRYDFTRSAFGDIQHTIEIDAPREAVYNALVKPELLERWIASKASVEEQVGGKYRIGWPMAWTISELVPNERLVLLGEGDDTSVTTWTLEGSGGKTRLTLVHSGFAADYDQSGINSGWLNYLSWIKSMFEYGDNWEPAIKRLEPDMYWIYPASMVKRQAELTG